MSIPQITVVSYNKVWPPLKSYILSAAAFLDHKDYNSIMERFNQEQHEKQLAERYRRLARYEAFNKLVDMALDGSITLEEAKIAWEADEIKESAEQLESD